MRTARAVTVALVLGLAGLAASAGSGLAAGKVEELSAALLTDPSFKVRTQAALLMGKLGDKAGVEPLIRALGDDNKAVRAMAAQSLGKLGGDKAATALRTLLQREKESFVRNQAERSLAIMATASPAAADAKDRKLYLKIGQFTGGTKAADAELLALLRSTLRKSLGELRYTGVVEGPEEKNLGKGGRPTFIVDGNVLKLEERDTGSFVETSCEVKVLIARWPSRSVILWTSAGAAVQGGKRDLDRESAKRDCLEASAGQLADSLVGYFKSQGG
jgi:predicted transcriptional regulator